MKIFRQYGFLWQLFNALDLAVKTGVPPGIAGERIAHFNELLVTH